MRRSCECGLRVRYDCRNLCNRYAGQRQSSDRLRLKAELDVRLGRYRNSVRSSDSGLRVQHDARRVHDWHPECRQQVAHLRNDADLVVRRWQPGDALQRASVLRLDPIDQQHD